MLAALAKSVCECQMFRFEPFTLSAPLVFSFACELDFLFRQRYASRKINANIRAPSKVVKTRPPLARPKMDAKNAAKLSFVAKPGRNLQIMDLVVHAFCTRCHTSEPGTSRPNPGNSSSRSKEFRKHTGNADGRFTSSAPVTPV